MKVIDEYNVWPRGKKKNLTTYESYFSDASLPDSASVHISVHLLVGHSFWQSEQQSRRRCRRQRCDGPRSRNYDFFKKWKLQKKYKKNTQKLHFCCFQNYPKITQKLHWHFCSFQNYKKNSQKIHFQYHLHREAVQIVFFLYFFTIFFVILKTAKMSM